MTVAAVQDLVALKGSSGKVCRCPRVWLFMNDVTLETAQGARLNCKYASATITLGSGGAAGAAKPTDPGDAAASFTSRTNDTTPATTSGSFVDVFPCGGHNFGLGDFKLPGEGVWFGLNEGFVFELLGAPAGTCNWSGGAEVWEYGS